MVVVMLLIAIWWIVVVKNDSAIFPTPWQVVTGALELARDGTLWRHIGASLFRVGIGFGLAFLVEVPQSLREAILKELGLFKVYTQQGVQRGASSDSRLPNRGGLDAQVTVLAERRGMEADRTAHAERPARRASRR
jgi:hypothetical protein